MALSNVSISAAICLLLAVVSVVLAGNDRAQWKCSKENNEKCQRDRSHCQTSIENCDGCIRHISAHMGSGHDRHCNEQRLLACKLTKNYVTALKAQSDVQNNAHNRLAIDLPNTYQSTDCMMYNQQCVQNNDLVTCATCVRVCSSVVTALEHILLFGEEVDEHTTLRNTCQTHQDLLIPAIEHIRDDGYDVNLVLVPNFPRHFFHCGLPTRGF